MTLRFRPLVRPSAMTLLEVLAAEQIRVNVAAKTRSSAWLYAQNCRTYSHEVALDSYAASRFRCAGLKPALDQASAWQFPRPLFSLRNSYALFDCRSHHVLQRGKHVPEGSMKTPNIDKMLPGRLGLQQVRRAAGCQEHGHPLRQSEAVAAARAHGGPRCTKRRGLKRFWYSKWGFVAAADLLCISRGPNRPGKNDAGALGRNAALFQAAILTPRIQIDGSHAPHGDRPQHDDGPEGMVPLVFGEPSVQRDKECRDQEPNPRVDTIEPMLEFHFHTPRRSSEIGMPRNT
jgi:hypothetical protein